MPNVDLIPDSVAQKLAPDGELADTAVTFRGWLSAKDDGDPLTGGIYRVYTSPWFDEWLEIKSGDLLFKMPTTESSIIWVKREARITKCHAAQACHFAEQEAELGADPTAANPTAAKYPRR